MIRPTSRSSSFLVLFALSLLFTNVLTDDHSMRYDVDEEVILYVNRVGPYANPQETYMYYSLPFCKPDESNIEGKMESLGEALQGYELRKSGIDFQFKKNVPRTVICSEILTEENAEVLKTAITRQYWYQMFLDNLPVWGMVGEVSNDNEGQRIYLFTHKKFVVAYNNDRIIEVNLTYTEDPVEVKAGKNISFTYSVDWVPTEIPFSERFEKYLEYNFFEHQIHWFSIFNSFMMVIFLTGLVSMILMRTLRKDYARYSRDDDDDLEDTDLGGESGWKRVHGDVFRAPPYLVLFSALVGTGHQLVVLIFAVVSLSFIGTYYTNRGTTVTAFVICYAFTSFVAGYGGGGYYERNNGPHWMKCLILTATLFPGACFIISFFLNFIAVYYGSLSAIPIGTMIVMGLIWAFVAVPLTTIGTIVGRNVNGVADNPCRVNPIARTIPEKPWYLHPIVNIILGGILPFGSIFIEMYFIFTSFWHYKYYYVYGFMLLVYVILIIVTVSVTIVSTYFLLNSEDYRWQWVSFLSSASTAVYVYIYAIYYFFMKTKMNGFLQTCFYFGYTAMFCLGLGIMCGALGFIGTSVFVKRIYKNVKID